MDSVSACSAAVAGSSGGGPASTASPVSSGSGSHSPG